MRSLKLRYRDDRFGLYEYVGFDEWFTAVTHFAGFVVALLLPFGEREAPASWFSGRTRGLTAPERQKAPVPTIATNGRVVAFVVLVTILSHG